MTKSYRPGDFDGTDMSESYEIGTDSGFTDTVENINTFAGPFMAPGEYWQIDAQLTLNTDPGSGPVFLEIGVEGGGDVIKRAVIEEFGEPTAKLSLVLPTYEAVGDFSAPASSSGSPDVRVNNVSGSTVNYFVDVQAIRLRDEIDDASALPQNGTSESFDSGSPS